MELRPQPAEIQATRDVEITVPTTGLLGRWGLNEGTGSTAADSSGNDITGTLTNGPTWVPGFVPQVNVAPVCVDGTLTTPANTPGDVAPSCTDANGNPISYAIVDQPAHGTASVVGGLLHYVPAGVYTGDDSFTYQASDGYLDSNTATVDVTVTPPPTNFGLQFDGTNDYVTFGQATSTLGVTTFTVEAWFKKTGAGVTTNTSNATGGGLTAAIPIVTKGRGEADASTVDMNYFLGIQGGTLAGDYEEGTGQASPGLNHRILGTTTLVDGTWYHAALTFDGTTLRLYLNGVEESNVVVGSGRLPQWLSTQHAGLATAMTSTGAAAGFFQGVIDEARVWNVARTQLEIAGAMNQELESGSGLIGRWGLNDDTGSTAANSVAGSPAGTLTNGPIWTTGFAQ